jgi:hypothetical protein
VKKTALVLALVLVVATAWLFWSRENKLSGKSEASKAGERREGKVTNADAVVIVNNPTVTPTQSPLLPGEEIMLDYGRPTLPPENDLTLVSRLMDNFTLLVKSMKDRPLSANGDWAAALRGRNPARERFLPDNHAAFNAQRELVDRWGTPLFFHALGGSRFDLRSAGPDRQLWTGDDIHRNYDGSFRRGSALNAVSLVDAPGR